MLLEGKTAVITGCNRGIGKATLVEMAENGANIIAVNRSVSSEFTEFVNEVMKKYNVEITTVYADFANEEEVKVVAREIISMKKDINIIVNNVGIVNKESIFTMIKQETIRNSFQVNYFAAILLTQYLVKSMMRKKGGSIVFISSSAAFDGGSNIEYCSSKAAVIGGARRMAVELGKFGIRVNVVAPGLTDTDMGNSNSKEYDNIAVSRNIMGRKGKPEEIASTIAYLASDKASFITGQVIRVDGGLLK